MSKSSNVEEKTFEKPELLLPTELSVREPTAVMESQEQEIEQIMESLRLETQPLPTSISQKTGTHKIESAIPSEILTMRTTAKLRMQYEV